MADYADHGIHGIVSGSGEQRVICPVCGPNRKPGHRNEKDLAVNRDKQTWFCHHCGEKGGLGLNPNGYGTSEKVWNKPKPVVVAASKLDKAYEYLLTRGIGQDIAEQEQVTIAESYCPQCEKPMSALAFPYYRHDAHINTTYIHRTNGDKHVWQEKGAERIMWGIDSITADAPMVIICEGQIDRLSFLESGFPYVLSVPDGAPDPSLKTAESKFSYLAGVQPLLEGKQIILAGDNDPAGQAMNAEISRRLGRERCRQIVWPEGINDANQALVDVGPALIAQAVEEARRYHIEGLFWSEEVDADTDKLYHEGYDPGLRTGYPNLDEHYRVRPGLLSVVTGVPGHGKSLWVDHILIRLMKKHHWNIGICSPENQPIARHKASLIEALAAKPFDIGKHNRMSELEYEKARDWLRERVAFILPERMDLETIFNLARIAIGQRGLNGLVIDPWNYLEQSRPPGMSETEYTSMALGQMKSFASQHDIHIWLIAHPTKWTAPSADQAPTMNSISGSAHFHNKADYGISIWRDPSDTSTPSQCHVEKVRFSETGKPGKIKFRYNVLTRQIEESNDHS